MGLRLILSLNSVCKGIKLYEVPDIDIAVCNLLWFKMSNLHRYFEIKSSGFTVEDDSGEEVTLWRLTSLSRWSVAKFKSTYNFEELPYVACVFFPRVIYENIDIVFIEINFIVFGLTRTGLKATIYPTQGEHTNHYATDAVVIIRKQVVNHRN